jgi:prolyl-tRNA editing enzyme YbaK/EbsC (Cys-tRNA(Pro) deacylase)
MDTQITRMLRDQGIPFRLLPHTEPVYTVEAAAAHRGVVKEEMVKSILLREKGSRRYAMACLAGDDRLQTQAVREYLPGEWKRLTFASGQEITEITGSPQGAVAPLCLPPDVPVVFDKAILDCEKVNISSGHPLAGIELAMQHLLDLSGAGVGAIATRS